MGVNSTITFKAQDPLEVDTPSLGKVRIFVGDDNFLKVIDSDGNIYEPGSKFLSDSGVPSNSIGYNGYHYLNTDNADLYEKVSGSWVLIGSFAGPTGPIGATGAGVPSGGTAGQIINKVDGTDYNTQWVDLTTNIVSHTPSDSGLWITNPTTAKIALDELIKKTSNNNQNYFYRWREHFIGNATTYSLGWACNRNGTASTSQQSANIITGSRPGQHLLWTGTTATGRSYMYLWPGSFVFGGGYNWRQMWDFNIPTLNDGVETYYINFGWTDTSGAATSDSTDGVYFQYDLSINPNWLLCCAKGGFIDKFDTGVAVATGWHQLDMRINSTGNQVSVYYDGVLINTYNSTNIPTSSGNVTGTGAHIGKTASNSSRGIYIDKFEMEMWK